MNHDHGNMDHGSMHSTTAAVVASVTSAAADAMNTLAATMDHGKEAASGGHGGHGGMGGSCKISMLWNWTTIDACFLARGWHVKTQAQFAGTCIGVALICIILELIRRLQREYDRAIVRQWQASRDDGSSGCQAKEKGTTAGGLDLAKGFLTPLVFKPGPVQQLIRAALYAIQFGIAYIIMLLAMYYNGYVIISIFLGIFVGHYIFGYDNITIGGKQETGTSCC